MCIGLSLTLIFFPRADSPVKSFFSIFLPMIQTGKAFFTPAVGISLMLFYAFAMQCMSTLAIVYRETRHWKWPLIQFLYMGVLAYISSFIAYQLLS